MTLRHTIYPGLSDAVDELEVWKLHTNMKETLTSAEVIITCFSLEVIQSICTCKQMNPLNHTQYKPFTPKYSIMKKNACTQSQSATHKPRIAGNVLVYYIYTQNDVNKELSSEKRAWVKFSLTNL